MLLTRSRVGDQTTAADRLHEIAARCAVGAANGTLL
jgi:hypothetical protein